MRRSPLLLVAATGIALTAPTTGATATALTADAVPAARVAASGTGHDGACSPEEGVTVVVRTPEETVIRCAVGDPESGEAALEAAGVKVTHDKNGMICQLAVAGEPFPREEKGWTCGDFDGTNFWAYFQATQPGGTWSFATKAANQTDPKPGQVEGWSWGAGEADLPGATAPAAAKDGAPSSPSPSAGASKDPAESPAPSASEDAPSPSASASESASSESSQVAPEGGSSGLLWTLGLLAVAALAVGAWMRFGRR